MEIEAPKENMTCPRSHNREHGRLNPGVDRQICFFTRSLPCAPEGEGLTIPPYLLKTT